MLKLCRSLKPDLVVLELELSGLAGLQVMRNLREMLPAVKTVVYTGSADDGVLREALAAGPEGFVRKSDEVSDLCLAVRTVAAGGRFVSPQGELLNSRKAPSLDVLSARELEVMEMVAEGMQTKEIADVLDTKARTVEHHRQHLMDKLGVHDLASLVRLWMGRRR